MVTGYDDAPESIAGRELREMTRKCEQGYLLKEFSPNLEKKPFTFFKNDVVTDVICYVLAGFAALVILGNVIRLLLRQ